MTAPPTSIIPVTMHKADGAAPTHGATVCLTTHAPAPPYRQVCGSRVLAFRRQSSTKWSRTGGCRPQGFLAGGARGMSASSVDRLPRDREQSDVSWDDVDVTQAAALR